MKANNTTLPKGYLSWSQLDLVERDPEEYIRRYVLGEESESTKYTDYGTKIHDLLAAGKLENSNMDIPLLTLSNMFIECVLTRKKDTLRLIGYLDGADQGGIEQVEYKTATVRWGARKAREHGQMKLYSLITLKQRGVIPNQKLVWIGTQTDFDGGLCLTGKYFVHPIKYELHELLEFEGRIWRGYDKINRIIKEEMENTF